MGAFDGKGGLWEENEGAETEDWNGSREEKESGL